MQEMPLPASALALTHQSPRPSTFLSDLTFLTRQMGPTAQSCPGCWHPQASPARVPSWRDRRTEEFVVPLFVIALVRKHVWKC